MLVRGAKTLMSDVILTLVVVVLLTIVVGLPLLYSIARVVSRAILRSIHETQKEEEEKWRSGNE